MIDLQTRVVVRHPGWPEVETSWGRFLADHAGEPIWRMSDVEECLLKVGIARLGDTEVRLP